MHSIVDRRDEVQSAQAAVLMARLEDCEGAILSPATIRSIEYLLVELAADRPGGARPVAGHYGRSLCVEDIVSGDLQTGEGWSVDDVGYNFRHRFSIRRVVDLLRRHEMLFEMRYVITHATGEKSTVRFRVRMF